MWTTATLTRMTFGFLLANLVLVVAVAALRPVLARQQADDSLVAEPVVQVPPNDPPSLPAKKSDGAVDTAELSLPVGPPAAPPNKMVMDEILKVIQDGRGELEVPPLNYPALPRISKAESTSGDLRQLAQRMKSIAQLTQSAQTLIAEAQHLKSIGRADAADALTEHIQTLRSIVVQLAADDMERTEVTQ